MGASKSAIFSLKLNEIANLSKALGHPARVAIMEHLLKVDSCMCDELLTKIPLSQPTISQHLSQLKSVGLIKGSVKKNAIYCCIDERGIEKLHLYFSDFSVKLKKKKKTTC